MIQTFERVSASQSCQFVEGVGLLASYATSAIRSDEIVLLVAHTAEVSPMGEFVVTDEVGELACSIPLVDEVGDEIDAGLDGEDKARFEHTAQTQ